MVEICVYAVVSPDPAVAPRWSYAFVHEIKVQRGVTRAVRPRAVRLEAGGTFPTSLLRGIRPLKGERAYLISPFKGFGGWRAVHVISQAFWAGLLLSVEVCFITSCERQQCYFSGKDRLVLHLLWNVKKLVRLCCMCAHSMKTSWIELINRFDFDFKHQQFNKVLISICEV